MIFESIRIKHLNVLAANGLANYAVEGEIVLLSLMNNCYRTLYEPEREEIRQCVMDHPEMVTAEVLYQSRSGQNRHICWYWQVFAPQEKRDLQDHAGALWPIVKANICDPGLLGFRWFYEHEELMLLSKLPDVPLTNME
jgi:hypothetical protein